MYQQNQRHVVIEVAEGGISKGGWRMKNVTEDVKNLLRLEAFVVYFQYLFCGKRDLKKVCCKGYSITLQEFKRNEGHVQGT